jgi:hypothetical protein
MEFLRTTAARINSGEALRRGDNPDPLIVQSGESFATFATKRQGRTFKKAA